jgi:nucleolar complex protein 2
MKNSASEIFCLNHQAAYQHAFRFIRQLAIHLRDSMKLKTKVCYNSNIPALFKRFITQESYKQVYNWQYVHAIDFWSLVLARACEVQGSADGVKTEDMRPLIYPLVQIATGAIKCVTHMSKFVSNLTSLA